MPKASLFSVFVKGEIITYLADIKTVNYGGGMFGSSNNFLADPITGTPILDPYLFEKNAKENGRVHVAQFVKDAATDPRKLLSIWNEEGRGILQNCGIEYPSNEISLKFNLVCELVRSGYKGDRWPRTYSEYTDKVLKGCDNHLEKLDHLRSSIINELHYKEPDIIDLVARTEQEAKPLFDKIKVQLEKNLKYMTAEDRKTYGDFIEAQFVKDTFGAHTKIQDIKELFKSTATSFDRDALYASFDKINERDNRDYRRSMRRLVGFAVVVIGGTIGAIFYSRSKNPEKFKDQPPAEAPIPIKEAKPDTIEIDGIKYVRADLVTKSTPDTSHLQLTDSIATSTGKVLTR